MEDNKESTVTLVGDSDNYPETVVTRGELQARLDKISQELCGVPSPLIATQDTDEQGAEETIEILSFNSRVMINVAAHLEGAGE